MYKLQLTLKKSLTLTNFIKIISLFTLGLLFRYLINEHFVLDILSEYITLLSLTCSSIMYMILPSLSEFFIHMNIFPNLIYIINLLKNKLSGILTEIYTRLYSLYLEKYPSVSYIDDKQKSKKYSTKRTPTLKPDISDRSRYHSNITLNQDYTDKVYAERRYGEFPFFMEVDSSSYDIHYDDSILQKDDQNLLKQKDKDVKDQDLKDDNPYLLSKSGSWGDKDYYK